LRNAGYLAAVIDADLPGTAAAEDAVEAEIAAFVLEKRKGLDVSLTLGDALPEVQGRQAIIEEARRFVPALQAKLAAAGAGTAETAQLAVALAAVEGAVWEMMAQDEAALGRPKTIAALLRVFRAVAGLSPAAAAR